MRMLIASMGILTILMFSSSSYANKPYLDKSRVAYISNVMQAFDETTLHDIFNTYSYINIVETNYCRSSLSDLGTECLMSYAKKNCSETGGSESSASCELYSDVIVVNKLSEKDFIGRAERYRMLKNTSDDFRTAMANRLQQKYAKIVTHFSLTDGAECDNDDFDCLAKGLDQFCLDYTNKQNLSWQHCVSASLWFIGISKSE
jgi:hypothetical protein